MRERLPALVRRQRLRRLPGDARLAGRRLGRRQGDAPPDGGRGPALRGGHVRHRGRPPVLHRGAAGLLSVRAGRPERARPGAAAPVQPLGLGRRPPRRCRTSTPTTATSTPRSSRARSAAPAPDGKPVVDLRWNIREGSPATINKVEIVGNDVTHERVIREAIVMLPGDLFSRERADPLVPERLQPGLLPAAAADARREAVGQRRRRRHHLPGRGAPHRQHQLRRVAGAGHRRRRVPRAGGAEPLRPGQARQAPVAVRQEHQRLHAELHRSRPSGRAGSRARSRCSTPAPATPSATWAAGSRPAAASSSASRSSARATPASSPRTPTSGSATPRARRTCGPGSAAAPAPARPSAPACSGTPGSACPFATGGSLTNVSGELNGGILGGTGNYQKVDLEGRWYAPLGTLGGGGPARRRGTVRARPHRQVGIHLRRRRAVLHRAVLAGRGAVRHPAPRLRRVLDHAERVRPVGERQPGQPGRLREVVRRLHGRGRCPDQPVALPEHVLRRGQRVPQLAPVGPDPAVPRRGLRGRRDLAAGTDRHRSGLRLRPGRWAGRPDPGWQLHFKLGNFF